HCARGTIMARVKIRLDEVACLPLVCVCCGAPATRTRQQEFQLDTALSAAITVTAAVLGALVSTKRGVTPSLPVSEYRKDRGRRSDQTFLRGTSLAVAFGAAPYLASLLGLAAASYLGVAATIAFIVTVVVAMHEVDDGLGVRSIKGDSLTLG